MGVAPGVELHVEIRSGDASAAPVVLVHGLASNLRLWDGVAEHLHAAGHTVIAVDQRGHGRSDAPDVGYDDLMRNEINAMAGKTSGPPRAYLDYRARQRLTALNYAIQTTPPPSNADEKQGLAQLHVRVAQIYRSTGDVDMERDHLDAAVKLVAREGINDVRIARIAMEAGVSPSLLHYHFATRDALLAEALEHSYELAGDIRIGGADEPTPATERLKWMIDQCLPGEESLHDYWMLWVELWLHAARRPELRPTSARLVGARPNRNLGNPGSAGRCGL